MAGAGDVEAVERGLEAAYRGDFESLREVVHPEALWFVGGRSAVAGEHKGPDGVVEHFRRLHALTDSIEMVGLDVGPGEAHAMATFLVKARRGDVELASHQTVVVHLDGGKWCDCFVYFEDQYAFDEFFA